MHKNVAEKSNIFVKNDKKKKKKIKNVWKTYQVLGVLNFGFGGGLGGGAA
jgi:hypothetical protein